MLRFFQRSRCPFVGLDAATNALRTARRQPARQSRLHSIANAMAIAVAAANLSYRSNAVAETIKVGSAGGLIPIGND